MPSFPPWRWSRRLAAIVLCLGIGLRIVPLLIAPDAPLATCDGRGYWNLATNLAAGRGLSIDDPVVAQQLCPLGFGPGHHFSPLLPIIEAGFILALGPGLPALVASLITVSLAMIGVVYWTTRDLFGRDAALAVSALMSIEWTTVLFGTRQGYSESLVLLTLVLTLWAILKSLSDERYIMIAGLAAGLGYLSKASAGWFFLIAGLGGLSWRLVHRGWRVFLDRNYLGAILIFGSIFGAWSARNLYHFWDGTPRGLLTQWQTSELTARAIRLAFDEPGVFAFGLIGKFPILVLGVVVPLLGLHRLVWAGLRDWRREDVSGLWLASVLLFALGWLFAAAFWVTEQSDLLWADPIRYVATAIFPLAWLVILTRPDWREHRGWTIAYGVGLLLAVTMPFLLGQGRVLGSS